MTDPLDCPTHNYRLTHFLLTLSAQDTRGTWQEHLWLCPWCNYALHEPLKRDQP